MDEARIGSPAFDWATVESPNFAEYAQNLRRAGFPDTAVQDALGPEILRHYAHLFRQNAPSAFAPAWVKVTESSQRQQRQEWDRLKRERKDLIESLFGTDPQEIDHYQPWEFNVRQEGFPFLKEDLQERLAQLKRERSSARAALLEGGMAEPEIAASLRPLIQRQETEMRTFLGPEVFERLASSP